MEQRKQQQKKLTKSKRFWFSVFAFVADSIIFTILVEQGKDPASIGTGLSMLNAPVFVYVFGESWKPSTKKEDEEVEV